SYLAAAALMMARRLAGGSTGGNTSHGDALDGGPTEEGTETGNDDGTDARPVDATADAVITPIRPPLHPDGSKPDCKTLIDSFNEGSVDDPTAGTGCVAIATLVADDEKGVISYPDGEIDCSTK